MPKKKNSSHDQTDSDADRKKPPVSRKDDQNNRHHRDGNDQASRPAERNPGPRRLKIWFHAALPLAQS